MSTEIIAIASILFIIILLLLGVVIVLIIILCRSSISFRCIDHHYQQNKKISYKRAPTSTTNDRYIHLKQTENYAIYA
jgi:hypothetical protein